MKAERKIVEEQIQRNKRSEIKTKRNLRVERNWDSCFGYCYISPNPLKKSSDKNKR